MKKALLNTSTISTMVVLLVICLSLFLVLQPENTGIIYYFNMLTSVVVCVLFSILLALPKRKYTSRAFLSTSWAYLLFFFCFTLVGIYLYYDMVADELSRLDIKFYQFKKIGHSLSETELLRYEELKDFRNIYLLSYYTAFISITAIWAFILRRLYLSDARSEEGKNFIDKSYEKAILVNKLMKTSDKYKEICKASNIYPKVNYKIERIANELRVIDSEIMAAPKEVVLLEEYTHELISIVAEMEATPIDKREDFNDKIKDFANNFLAEIRKYKIETGVLSDDNQNLT